MDDDDEAFLYGSEEPTPAPTGETLPRGSSNVAFAEPQLSSHLAVREYVKLCVSVLIMLLGYLAYQVSP